MAISKSFCGEKSGDDKASSHFKPRLKSGSGFVSDPSRMSSLLR